MEPRDFFKAVEERNSQRAGEILSDIAREAGQMAYRETMDHCLEVYPKIISDWGLEDAQAADLIGVDQDIWRRIKAGDKTLDLSDDQTGKISTLFLIYSRLHLFDHEFAIRWPTLHNRGGLFGGRTPVEAMTAEGFSKMREVLAHVESLALGDFS